MVLAGEGDRVEFKVEVPRDAAARREVARTVAAFSNGDGGTVLFGTTDEDGEVVGISQTEIGRNVQDSVADFVRNLLSPLPRYALDRYDLDDRPGASSLPCESKLATRRRTVSSRPTRSTTFPASADQVRTLARSRPPTDQRFAFPYPY